MSNKRKAVDYRSTYRDFNVNYSSPNGTMEWYDVGVLMDGTEEVITTSMAKEIGEYRQLRQVVEFLESEHAKTN